MTNVRAIRPYDHETDEWSSSWVKCTDLEWSVLTMAARKAKISEASAIADRIITDVKRQQRLRLDASVAKHPSGGDSTKGSA